MLFIVNETLGNQARNIRPREPNDRTHAPTAKKSNECYSANRQLGSGRTHISDWNLPRDEVFLDSFERIFLSARAGRCACLHT